MKVSAKKIFSLLRKKTTSIINYPFINVKELILGKNVVIEPNVQISCDRLILGDGVRIKSGTQIYMSDLVIGDYTLIYNNCFFSGTRWCRIGHNCWFGHYTIVDSIGAHSQLWTHAYFGDILEGCRFASHKQLSIGDDVWLVGHCIVSPINAERRSMAMAGSVVTKDMGRSDLALNSRKSIWMISG
jgi:acetyltransferase-like isoleucine patch superfamily enzyme